MSLVSVEFHSWAFLTEAFLLKTSSFSCWGDVLVELVLPQLVTSLSMLFSFQCRLLVVHLSSDTDGSTSVVCIS